MKTPSKVLEDLSDKSLASGQSLQDWLDYLLELHDELKNKIAVTMKDIKNAKKQ